MVTPEVSLAWEALPPGFSCAWPLNWAIRRCRTLVGSVGKDEDDDSDDNKCCPHERQDWPLVHRSSAPVRMPGYAPNATFHCIALFGRLRGRRVWINASVRLVTSDHLENLLHENRHFPPSPEFAEQANASVAMYAEAVGDRMAFWDEQAGRLSWEKRWGTTLDWSNAPFAKWFVGGRINVAVNCVDRHVADGFGDQVAIHFEGEPGDTRAITYRELQDEVSQAANALTELGIEAGDRVAIYLPMIPEAVISMLACARIGAPPLGRLRWIQR